MIEGDDFGDRDHDDDDDDDNDNDDVVPTLVECLSSAPAVRATVESSSTRERVPVTILTGYLGSGKTTLLNHILKSDHGKRIAVVENEFSAGLGIEGMIAKSGVDGRSLFLELNNGCICCTVKDDLLVTLEQLVTYRDKFDYILIEATGVANPGPLISSLWADEGSDSPLQLDGVITVVDASNLLRQLADPYSSKDVTFQIAYADRIIVNKLDLIDSSMLSSVTQSIREINSFASLQHSSFSKVDVSWVLDINSFSFTRVSRLFVADKVQDNILCLPCSTDSINVPAVALPNHSQMLSSVAFTFHGCFDLVRLKTYLVQLLYDRVTLRSKTHTLAVKGSTSSIVHEKIVGSTDAGIADDEEIYRIKGLLRIRDQQHLYILQAIHDVFDLQPSDYDIEDLSTAESAEASSSIIVIGHHLNTTALLEGFQSCLHSSFSAEFD